MRVDDLAHRRRRSIDAGSRRGVDAQTARRGPQSAQLAERERFRTKLEIWVGHGVAREAVRNARGAPMHRLRWGSV
jgi:hypothetical protein